MNNWEIVTWEVVVSNSLYEIWTTDPDTEILVAETDNQDVANYIVKLHNNSFLN